MIRNTTTSISTKENEFDECDLSLLGEEISNTKILGSNEKVNKSKDEDMQKPGKS